MMRKILAINILIASLGAIVFLLWQEEYRYSLPTPIPKDYQTVVSGECISAADSLYTGQKPLFVHFYNPHCPCSRFNLAHFLQIWQQYHEEVFFQVIIPEGTSLSKARYQLGDQIPLLTDTGEFWAKSCGVYATPQAVIIAPEGDLYYRGNYNKARFCTIPGTNFAELSLQMLLSGRELPQWGPLATVAYGCQMPEHTEASFSLSWVSLKQQFQ